MSRRRLKKGEKIMTCRTDSKYCVVRIRGNWYFQRFDLLSTNKIPDYYIVNNINQAARMGKDEAIDIARMYGGEVIEREGGMYT